MKDSVAFSGLVNKQTKRLILKNMCPYSYGPGCSKLKTSLVNVLLIFQKLISQICNILC